MVDKYTVLDIDSGDGKIILFQENTKCYIGAICMVSVLFGKVECFGHIMTDNESGHIIFSHSSTGIFHFECLSICEETSNDYKKSKLYKYISNLDYPIDNYSSALLLKNVEFISMKLYSQICKKFIGLDMNYKIFINEWSLSQNIENRLNRGFLHLEGWNDIVRTLVDKNNHSKKLISFLSCGQKSSGKSTLNRYVANRFLSLGYKVYWLDCDMGQSEFTPSGSISLINITKPLFGPSFSHILTNSSDFASIIASCYIGDNSPSNCLTVYIKTIEYLFSFFTTKVVENDPSNNTILVINSQGWIENVGQDLLIDIIRITHPDLIVQLSHINSHSSLNITNDLIYSKAGYYTHASTTQPNYLYTIGKLLTETTGGTSGIGYNENTNHTSRQNSIKFKPNEMRLCSWMEYLFYRHDKHCRFLLPYIIDIQRSISFYKYIKIRWCDIYISFSERMNCYGALLESLPLKIVGLCSYDTTLIDHYISLRGQPSESEIGSQANISMYSTQIRLLPYQQHFNCLGLGIIRNIDLLNECFYILTPLHPNRLSHVNVLVVGNNSLPHELIYSAFHTEQHPSYHGPVIKRRRNLPKKI